MKTPKLKTALKYKGDRRKILLNLYYQKNNKDAYKYKVTKGRPDLYFLYLWTGSTKLSSPLLEMDYRVKTLPQPKGYFYYTLPYYKNINTAV